MEWLEIKKRTTWSILQQKENAKMKTIQRRLTRQGVYAIHKPLLYIISSIFTLLKLPLRSSPILTLFFPLLSVPSSFKTNTTIWNVSQVTFMKWISAIKHAFKPIWKFVPEHQIVPPPHPQVLIHKTASCEDTWNKQRTRYSSWNAHTMDYSVLATQAMFVPSSTKNITLSRLHFTAEQLTSKINRQSW